MVTWNEHLNEYHNKQLREITWYQEGTPEWVPQQATNTVHCYTSPQQRGYIPQQVWLNTLQCWQNSFSRVLNSIRSMLEWVPHEKKQPKCLNFPKNVIFNWLSRLKETSGGSSRVFTFSKRFQFKTRRPNIKIQTQFAASMLYEMVEIHKIVCSNCPRSTLLMLNSVNRLPTVKVKRL